MFKATDSLQYHKPSKGKSNINNNGDGSVTEIIESVSQDWNNQHKNKALYLNRGLFSPGIWFFRKDEHAKCSVITCASPNKSSAQKYMNVSDEENSKVLRSRIKFVLDVAKDNNITTLILGAYGCGVFGQDATEVASIFNEYLLTTHTCFDKVVFAIPNSKDGNLEKFVKVFSWN